MRSNMCPLCGEGWPEQHDWITDEMVERASAEFAAWRPSRPTHREAMRAALQAALSSAQP